jgi:Tfp pilus assembly protein PilF
LRHQPLYWPGHLFLAYLLEEQGDTAGALRESEAALEQDPRNTAALTTLARVSADAGDLRKARAALERIRNEDRQNSKVRLMNGLLLAHEGRVAEARRELDDRTQAYAALAPDSTLMVAEILAVIGDTASALRWVDQAVRAGDEREDWFRRDPHLASVRGHSDFQKMLASVAFRREQRAQASSKPR